MSVSVDPVFDRPVFIVSSPVSGARLLFDALMRAPAVYTAGGAQRLIDQMPGLSVRARGFTSDRLLAQDADETTAATLRQRLIDAAVDRNGVPAVGARLSFRLLDKAPKNGMRIPFLAKAFPKARFIYLHRDPREVLSNMLLAWTSGKHATYQKLPGWPRPYWSLALIPGWRELAGKPLADIIARQWQVATDIMLDGLDELPADRWMGVRHADLLENPSGTIARLCLALDYAWDRPLDGDIDSAKPESSLREAAIVHEHAADLQRVWPGLEKTVARADRMAGG